MIDPYRMIVVNIIAVFVVGVGLILYSFIFKRKINLFYILLMISLLPLISILRKGSYESGDLTLHVKFAMQFFENLSQGNYFPEWIGRHCSGYGCPVYIFLFTLPYYIVAFFHLIGLSFLTSMKTLLITSFIFSGIGMFIWIRNELNEKAGFVAAIFYLFSPYHLIDLHFRVSIGELLSIAIIPFAFYFTKRLVETGRNIFLILNILTFALLILSHQVVSLVSMPLLLLYGFLVFLREKKKNYLKILTLIISIFYGAILTAYYWIPIIVESKYISYNAQTVLEFHPLSSFLYSQNMFGLLFQGHHGELYLNVGYVQWIIVAISLYLLIKKKLSGKIKSLAIGCVIIFSIFFISMQEFTRPIWNFFPFFNNFQFTWRLMVEIMLTTSVLTGIVVTKIKNNTIIIILCFITILFTMLNWGNRKTVQANDAILKKEQLFDEYPGGVDLTTPNWVDRYKPWVGSWPEHSIETLSGNADFKVTKRSQTVHEYIIDVNENALVKENTYYYPGWKVFANNKELPIIYNHSNFPGVIIFNLKKGHYNVKLTLVDTEDRKYSKLLSLSALILMPIFLIYRRLFNIKIYKRTKYSSRKP